jgi:hypothetical protein
MKKRRSKRLAQDVPPAPVPANDDAISALNSSAAAPASAANDNRPINNLPACLAVSDDEVKLLQQYLSQEILALFG